MPVAPGSIRRGPAARFFPAPQPHEERVVVRPPSRPRQGCLNAPRHQQRAEQGIAADQAGEAPSSRQNSGVRRGGGRFEAVAVRGPRSTRRTPPFQHRRFQHRGACAGGEVAKPPRGHDLSGCDALRGDAALVDLLPDRADTHSSIVPVVPPFSHEAPTEPSVLRLEGWILRSSSRSRGRSEERPAHQNPVRRARG